MPFKDKEREKEYNKKYYQENKEYCGEKRRKYQRDNKERLRECSRLRQATYIRAWKSYFSQEYSEHPTCQICGKLLNWSGDRKSVVYWDHKNNKSNEVKVTPANWYRPRPCNLKNIVKWVSFDFGILCAHCNGALPTQNRDEWVKNLLKYIGR